MQIDKVAGKVVNEKGQEYFFHVKENIAKPYLKTRYFSKSAEGAVPIPETVEIFVNPRTGLPMARNKK
jgi:hypothetical protein